MMNRTERAALQRLTVTPAPAMSGEWEAARGSLANSVPDLLSDLEQLRAAALAAVAWCEGTSDDLPAPVAELQRLTDQMNEPPDHDRTKHGTYGTADDGTCAYCRPRCRCSHCV